MYSIRWSNLVDKEAEIKSLKEQFGFFLHHCKRNSLHSPEPLAKMNLIMRRKIEREIDNEVDKTIEETNSSSKAVISPEIRKINSVSSLQSTNESTTKRINQRSSEEDESEQAKIIDSVTQLKQEIEEEKEVNIDQIHTLLPKVKGKVADKVGNFEAVGQSVTKKTNSSWKMDIQALGVTYKIQRLKQQLLVLEKLAGMKQIMIDDDKHDGPKDSKIEDNKQQLKGFILVIHLLNKQVKIFQTLKEKTDDLCRRMHENSRGGNRRDSSSEIKEQSRKLEGFLKETFQLQRYMVATGQKMMDIQSKITSSFDRSDELDESAGFNMNQFADVIRTLFKEIHRGLEIRIAQIIGDIEGTLIHHK